MAASRKPRGADRRRREPLRTDRATSERLGRVRQRDTQPELAVRKEIRRLGLAYRTRNRDLPGSPDIANRRRRWAVFVHGCFWHAHRGCPKATVPRRNRDFWVAKFRANRARDSRAERELRKLGFTTVVIWECEIVKPGVVGGRLALLPGAHGTGLRRR